MDPHQRSAGGACSSGSRRRKSGERNCASGAPLLAPPPPPPPPLHQVLQRRRRCPRQCPVYLVRCPPSPNPRHLHSTHSQNPLPRFKSSKLAKEPEDPAVLRKRKSMEHDEPQQHQQEQPQQEQQEVVGPSQPSTSDPDLVFDEHLVQSYEAGYYSDDPSPQVSDELTVPLIGDKEPLSVLASQLQGIMKEKAVLLTEKYAALRRSRGDGSCFFRSFMFSYLEHILVTQDRAEVERILIRIEQSRVHLYNLGYAEFTYEDFFTSFTELLESCLSGTEASLSPDELLEKACDQSISNNGVMFLRFITSAEIQNRADFFAPFIADLGISIAEFCKKKVEPMKEESEQMHVIALSDALGVPIRVVYLDSQALTTKDHTNENYHDFCPSAGNNITNKADPANESTGLSKQEKRVPFVTLLYRPGHYDILYPI